MDNFAKLAAKKLAQIDSLSTSAYQFNFAFMISLQSFRQN